MGCPAGMQDCEPITSTQMVCEFKNDTGGGIPPMGLNPCGDPFGGGCGDGGYEYPEPPENTPCEKIKTQNTNTRYKEKLKFLKEKTSANYESGFRVGNPIAGSGQTEAQFQQLRNFPGTHILISEF
ncbi:hypothetical protein [Chryseobacterium sp. CFBP8996]|uniref:hypothetical protein n=1 Tax=Chryseobacterium sp. CFBP8996 TaxID=3096529 RepID=UPI002A6A1361|nr:hypothetical protein [Chryseobacterium sp. CFBP8996]MDY0933274.1 hypothetical protein [Chryseobacterium sp. CFBP8996]